MDRLPGTIALLRYRGGGGCPAPTSGSQPGIGRLALS